MRKITLLLLFLASGYMTAQDNYDFGLVHVSSNASSHTIAVYGYPDFTDPTGPQLSGAGVNITLTNNVGTAITEDLTMNCTVANDAEGGEPWAIDNLECGVSAIPSDGQTLAGVGTGIGDGTRDFYRWFRNPGITFNHPVTSGVGFEIFSFTVSTAGGTAPTEGTVAIMDNSDTFLADLLAVAGLSPRNYYSANITGTTQDHFRAISTVGSIDFVTLSNPEAELTGFSMYPNPANNEFFVKGLELETEIKIHDMNGKLVMSQENYTGDRIDVSQLQTGVYFVNIANDNGSTTEKLIVE